MQQNYLESVELKPWLSELVNEAYGLMDEGVDLARSTAGIAVSRSIAS